MDIKSLRYFLHVAEALSFNKAAERLHVTQPVVTRAIAQLEHSLGSKLFERTTRRVALTPAGVVLLREARPLMGSVEAVRRQVRHAIGDRKGRFVVGVTSIALLTVAPMLLRRFQERLPAVELVVKELPSQAQVEALASADIDLGLLLAPASHPALQVQIIHRERMRLAVPDDHPHAVANDGRATPLSAFAHENFIVPSRQQNSTIHDEVVRTCVGAGFRPKVKECEENQNCLALARARMGVVFVPSKGPDLPADGLAILELEDPTPQLDVAMAWRTDDPTTHLAVFRSLMPGFHSESGE